MDAIRLSNLSKKYPRLTLSGCKDLGLENLSLWQKLNSFVEFPQLKRIQRNYDSALYSLYKESLIYLHHVCECLYPELRPEMMGTNFPLPVPLFIFTFYAIKAWSLLRN